MSVVGDRAWNADYQACAAEHDPREQAKRRFDAACARGALTADDWETMRRIVGHPSRLPMFGRPAWRRW